MKILIYERINILYMRKRQVEATRERNPRHLQNNLSYIERIFLLKMLPNPPNNTITNAFDMLSNMTRKYCFY